MSRLKFGTFLAPHHPLGEHPMLQFQRDLDFAAHLDRLGFDEFWCGEHHSSGWEMIASPEMFLAAAGQRTERIMLGTGVVSLPYHHPFNVAQRIVQLDHMTKGRAMFGSGPGALPSDAHTLGIDPMVQRDRQDEALGVIIRLLRGEERFSYESEWFTLRDAQLQILPLQEDMPMTAASSISPSGHADRRQVRHRRALDRVDVVRGAAGAADAVVVRRGSGREARQDRRPQELARADELAPRGVEEGRREGSEARPAALAQRVQRARARPPRTPRASRMPTSCSGRPSAAAQRARARPSSARPTSW